MFRFMAALLCVTSLLLAQTGNGSVQGTVKDLSGAVVPGARVALEQTATGRTFSTESSSAGLYVFPSLTIGSYKITVESPGLETFRASFVLQAGQTAVIDPQLRVNATTTEVTVSAESVDVTPILTTTAPTLANVVERQRIEQLPINGRFFQNLVQLTTPGVEGTGNPRVYGLRAGAMEFTQDGASLNHRNTGNISARPPGVDTINEFRVETSVSSAKFNRPASTIVTTKSGSNQVHGSLFWTGRNNGFGVARRRQDFYDAPPQLIRNEYGASVGGPVWLPKIYNGRNKTFFFFAWESFHLRQASTISAQMPTVAMREGDFSGLLDSAGRTIQLYDPWSTGAAPTFSRVPYSNNRIPIARRSPLAAYFYSVTPIPSLPDVNPVVSNNWFGPSPNTQDHVTYTTRIDHRLSSRDQIFGRYTIGNRILEQKRSFNNTAPITDDRLANFEFLPVYSQTGSFSWTRTMSPSLFLETVVTGMNEDNNYNTNAPGLDEDVAARLKLPNPFKANGLPDATSLGFGNFIYQGPRPRKDVTQVLTGEQNFTWLKGKHQVEFGWRYRQENLDVLPDQEQNQGSHAFNSLATALYDPASGAGQALSIPRTGHDQANFFLGVAAQYSATFNRGWYHFRMREFASYIQDNWKITGNLTVNLGLRHEFFSPVRERDNILMGFDLKTLSMASPLPVSKIVEAGYTTPEIVREYERLGVRFRTTQEAGLPNNLISPNYRDFGPRVGVAWKTSALGRQWVLRGGYGMYRFPPPIRTFNARMRANPPMTANSRLSISNAAQTPDGLPNYGLRSAPTIIAGLNSQNALPANEIAPFARGSFGAAAFEPIQPTTRAEEYNVTLETTILRDTLLRAGYVGTRGRNVDLWQRLNDAPNNYVWFLNTGLPVPTGEFSGVARRPLDNRVLGQIEYYTKGGYSDFNGVQLEVSRRYKSGYSYQFFYVLSNALSTGNIDTGNSATNAVFNPEIYLTGSVPLDTAERNRFLNYRRDTDIPKHRFRWNFLLDLPFGKGKKWLASSNKLMNAVVGGWQLAGFGSYRSRYWELPSTNWGFLGNVEVYGKKYPIEDCRSGQCIPGYLYWNGYIAANRINSRDAQGRPNGVMGVPENYRPSNLPVWPTPANGGAGDPNFALFDTNQVSITLKNGTVQRVGIDNGIHPWRQQYLPAPWVFDLSGSLFKTIPLTERVALRLNADFFQVLNNPGLAAPGANGILSLQNSNNAPRELQLTMRLTF
jgi:hypothetical protein